MIRGPILRVVASVTFPFAVLLTLYFFLSGHNNPGGGFIAGVLMSGAISMQFLAYGPEDVPKFLRLPYEKVAALGLAIALVAATAPLAAGYPFLTSFHATVDVPVLGAKMEFALAQLFDFGIFLLVAAGVMAAVLALAEDGDDATVETPLEEETASPEADADVETEEESVADDGETDSEPEGQEEPAMASSAEGGK